MGEKESSIERTNSGVKKKGNWKEITEFGRKVEKILGEYESDSEALDRFNDWRPKIEESEGDVKRKTVDEATLEEKKLEEKSNGVKKDFKQATDKMAEAGEKAAKKEVPDEELVAASGEAAKPFYSKIASLIRKTESVIYSWFTLRFNPYYLDTEDFSVDIKDKNNGEFEMDVSVHEDEKRKNLQEEFREED